MRELVWQRISDVDAAVLCRLRRIERRWVTALMHALTRLGETGSWLILALVLLAAGGDGGQQAAHLLGGAGSALVSSQILKRTFRRPRPSVRLPGFAALTENPDAFSFPSGHTAVAFGVAVAMAGQGAGFEWVLFPLAAGIGVSRVYLGAHYPLDVACGTLAGSGSGLIARSLLDGSLSVTVHTASLLLGMPLG